MNNPKKKPELTLQEALAQMQKSNARLKSYDVLKGQKPAHFRSRTDVGH